MSKKVLMVVTDTEKLDKDTPTGLWLSEFVEPSTELKQAGFEVTAASMKGGRAPIDPNSYENELPRVWDGVMEPIHDMEKLSEVNPSDYAGIFFCGGHGTMVDFPNNETIQEIVRHFISEKKVIAAVCHGPSAFVGVTNHNDVPFVRGKKMTGFTNEEERGTGLDSHMPFLLEDELEKAGADFVAGEAASDHVEVDGTFVTGQNPQSSLQTAQKMIEQLKKQAG
ncbi:type 1 glutamine amidotransferase domain-containing protein [Halobacillus litoralis]|uniref:type 1 glutamine amidotransferase domain-containing protein n=1 Tax=Halobacillus litoralis TaxID=45668 RepID=UPI001CD4FC73|nr:type 1 glutamine amidotransferase domain-containing protein [Halobacillus litoralis]MCA0971095.1 type 1 glutamine amidotransferase domain-containing protein [Halobacillus litoralis]